TSPGRTRTLPRHLPRKEKEKAPRVRGFFVKLHPHPGPLPQAGEGAGQGTGRDQKSMPPMPPIPPPPPPPWPCASSFFVCSATLASVVIIRPAIEAAFCSAERVTLVGSRMPSSIMSP